jgi:hypothetical protein
MTIAGDYDGPWKEALEVYLEEVLAFFFPEVHAAIDWTREPEWQDKELQLVAPDSERGSQTVDKLVRVWRRDGEEARVLVHIEVQSQQDPDFAERMFRYHARLFDHYRRNVVSLAILGDERPHWRPDRFEYELWGCSLRLLVPAVKLRDFDLAHPTVRARAKVNLTRRLYQRGYDRVAIQRLYRFIDWLLQLPEDLETVTWLEIKAMQEEQEMTYVTTAERYGRSEGLREGRSEGLIEGLIEGLQQGIVLALKIKFGLVGSALTSEIREIRDPALLRSIMERIETAATVDEVRATYSADN